MPFEILFKRLFEVEFWQNFYLNRGADEFASLSAAEQEESLESYRSNYRFTDDFRVIPTAETRRLLSGLGLLWRTSSTGFFVAAPVEERPGGGYNLGRPPTGPLRLRFVVSLTGSTFVNYTNIGLQNDGKNLYYFSNLGDQGERSLTFPYLSLFPAAYELQSSYEAGDIVRRQQGPGNRTLYLAVTNGSHGRPPPNPGSTSAWKRLSGRNYVTGDDRVTLCRQVFWVEFPPDTVVDADFTVTNEAGDVHDVGTASAPAGQTLSRYALNLDALPPGRYHLTIDGVDTDDDPYERTDDLYLDPELAGQSPFALIEIFHDPGSPADDFSLIAPDDSLRQPRYVIHFLNRYTFWRYFFASAPDPAPDASDFDRIDDQQYVSKETLPLTSTFVPIRAGGVRLLPNPSTRQIKPENNRQYSDIHVHP